MDYAVGNYKNSSHSGNPAFSRLLPRFALGPPDKTSGGVKKLQIHPASSRAQAVRRRYDGIIIDT